MSVVKNKTINSSFRGILRLSPVNDIDKSFPEFFTDDPNAEVPVMDSDGNELGLSFTESGVKVIQNLEVGGNLKVLENLSVVGDISSKTATFETLTVTGGLEINGDISVGKDLNLSGNLTVDGDTTLNGDVFFDSRKLTVLMGDGSEGRFNIAPQKNAADGYVLQFNNGVMSTSSLKELLRSWGFFSADSTSKVIGYEVGDIRYTFKDYGDVDSVSGFLKLNGQTVSRTGYINLYNHLISALGDRLSRTNDSFTLPDMRGMFPRIVDDGRGYDSGRQSGTGQDSGVPNIWGQFKIRDENHSGLGAFVLSDPWEEFEGRAGRANCGRRWADFNAARCSGVYKSNMNEVRPRNLAMYAYIKY